MGGHRSSSPDGFGLEVILSAEDEEEVTKPNMHVNSCASTRGRGGSGVAAILGDESQNKRGLISSAGGSVDKDRCEAFHIIDIQDDLGLNFGGQEDDAAKRIMEFEERDRCEKLVWEQQQGYQ
ncbi:hypothetical protein A2U01_0010443 [Trifolium medium]|uniref:Uncharacterized protein n=1 Tax=Trifolium medium TaxID=97028 RepID=A0A392MTF8_9FABA|nr:hypothetical protein [Trifolium medium]